MFEQSANRRPSRRNLGDTRHSRRLLVQRLREIDRLSARELAAMQMAIQRIKNRKQH